MLVVTVAADAARRSICCALPITSATATCRSRCAPIGCSSSPTMCSPRCCAAWVCRSRRREGPFEPEAGAYDTASPGHGHVHAEGSARHDHAHDHGHDARPRSRARPRSARRSRGLVTPAALLQLMRLASPSLPVGGFSYSEGIESAVETGRVIDEATRRALARRSAAPRPGAQRPAGRRPRARGLARGDDEAVASLNRLVRDDARDAPSCASRPSRWDARSRSGCSTAAPPTPRLARLEALRPAPTWPVAFALAAADSEATPRDVLVAFAAGWAENMVQATMKAVPLGQLAAQRLLARALGRDRPGRRRRPRPPRRRHAGVHADAGDPLGAARNPVLAPVPLLTRPTP